MTRLVEWLERGNGGLRTLLQLGGLLVSLVVIIFTLGGIWYDLRRTGADNAAGIQNLTLEMKGLRKDMTDVKTEVGLNSYFRTEHPKDHALEDRRLDRLERFQDRTPNR